MRGTGATSLPRVVAIAAIMVLMAVPALAQGTPFGVARPEPAMMPSDGPLAGFFAWIAAHQSALYRLMSDLVTAFRTDPWAGVTLIGLSFGYGVLHAAGPGHGKAVISSYLVATGEGVRRGVVLSFASAFIQALTAVVVVGIFTVALRATSMAVTQATFAVEVASYVLVTAIGAWLVYRKATALLRPAPEPAFAHAGHGRHHHEHHHDHAHGACCGHSHGPDPADLAGPMSLRRAFAAVAAVGLRPCTGAILVLVFAFSQGVFAIGVASAFAMAVGTGLTVAIIAGLAVGARGLAARLAAGGNGVALFGLKAVELAAALLVLLFGVVLLGGALSSA